MQLSETHKQSILELIRNFSPDAEVFVFGSYAKGKARRDSDLDLAIKATHRIAFEDMLHLKSAFSDSNLPFVVDLVDLNAIDAAFLKQISPDLTRL